MDPKRLMKQMQKMQRELAKAQEELAEEVFEGTAGGGAVKISITGAGEVTRVEIDPSAVDPDDPSLLEDLVLAAINEAMREQQTVAEQRLGGLTSGMGLPGLP